MRFDLVSNELYRGSHPESMSDLYTLKMQKGILRIVSLETFWHKLFGWKNEAIAWEHVHHGLFLNFPLSNIFPPSQQQTLDILHILQEPSRLPTFIHCYAGCDRTGWICASWRVLNDGWTPAKAWQEALDMGMHSRYSFWWKYFFMKMWEN